MYTYVPVTPKCAANFFSYYMLELYDYEAVSHPSLFVRTSTCELSHRVYQVSRKVECWDSTNCELLGLHSTNVLTTMDLRQLKG